MNAHVDIKPGLYRVGAAALPPWDRSGGAMEDLTDRIGRYVAVGPRAAHPLLEAGYERIRTFFTEGILREGRIVEAPFKRSGTTFVCVAACYWSRLYLEPGECPITVRFGDAAKWTWDAGKTDVEGRNCIRVRPHRDGTCDDMTIDTDRRTYRIRLVGHDAKVTIGCSWTYPGGTAASTPAGEQRPRHSSRAGTIRTTRYIIFKLGKSLGDLVMEWAQTLVPTKAWQIQKYKTLRRRARVGVGHPHPPMILQAVFKRLMKVGTISEPEIRQWLEVDGKGQELIDYFKEIATGLRRNRGALPGGVSPSPNDMLDPFPFLAGLPETCYEDEETYAAAPERARAIAWTMNGLAPSAALFCAIAPRYLRRPDAIVRSLQTIAALERIAEGAGLRLALDDPDSIDVVASHLLESPACSHLSGITRFEMLSMLRLLIRTLRRYIRFKDPDNAHGLAALRPAEVSRALSVRLWEMSKDLGAQSRVRRKRRVFQYAGKLSELEFAADLNLEQVVIVTKALASAAKDLGSRDWTDVPVPMTIVDPKGQLRPGKQVCTWRVWKPLPYHRLLLSKTSEPQEIKRLKNRIGALESAPEGDAPLELIHEYRGTRGTAGSKPIEPFHVTCWRYGLIARPSRLPTRIRHKRQTILQELRLPGYSSDKAELLCGSESRMDLWRISLRQHRTIAYLDAFEHALRFAHFGLSSVLENFSRPTAWMQQTQDQSGWEVRTLNGVKTAGFLAHDKQTGELREEMTWFPVGPKHQEEAMELANMTCRRCGYSDGFLPEIHHLQRERWKRPDRQAWLFSYNGSILITSYLHRYLRFLLPGWGRVTYYDFRHLGANAAFEDGVPGWMIRLTLNHGLTNMWEYYATQSAAQTARFEDSFVRSRFERSAHARSSRAAAQERFG